MLLKDTGLRFLYCRMSQSLQNADCIGALPKGESVSTKRTLYVGTPSETLVWETAIKSGKRWQDLGPFRVLRFLFRDPLHKNLLQVVCHSIVCPLGCQIKEFLLFVLFHIFQPLYSSKLPVRTCQSDLGSVVGMGA